MPIVTDGRRKLTANQVVEIRAANAEGASQISLAHRYGITPQAVHLIVHRVTWKHI
jgi:predicted transcriptional regulator